MKTSRLKRYLVFLAAVLIGGCFSLEPEIDTPVPKLPLGQDGEVILYLQPLPPGADKLRFEIGGISAVKDDGASVPLSLSLTELRGADFMGLQKLLANGILAPGHYTGISVQIKRAWSETAEGQAALEVSEEPVEVALPFDVARQKALALFLTLNPGRQIKGENQFSPVFSLASARQLLINLTALVSNSESNIITVFNKQTMQVADVIAAGQGPKGMALNQLRGLAYAAAARDDTILEIDVFKRQIINKLKLNFRDNPVDLVLTPDGRRLVSVNHDSNTVSLIDTFSMTEERRMRVGEGPAAAIMDPTGTRVFILNTRSRSISVVDLSQNTLVVTIGVEASPLRGTFNREGNLLYVVSGDSPYLTAVDRSRLAVAEKIFVGPGAVSIKADSQTGLLYVGLKTGAEVAVIDPSSSMFVDSFQVDGRPVFLAIDDQERSLFAALSDRNILQKINIVSKKTVAEIEVGKGAYSIVVMGER